MKQVLAWLGSMKLAVVLLVYLAGLTFYGTHAQRYMTLPDVQKQIFEGWAIRVWSFLAVPGAYPVLILLFVNLLVGGILRLKLRTAAIGILITHLGIALLLLQGFVKLNASTAGMMPLFPGESSRTYRSDSEYELAILSRRGDEIAERTVGAERLVRAGGDPVRLIAADLPFVVEVTHYQPYALAMPKGPMVRSDLPVVRGAVLMPVHREDPDQQRLYPPGCYVRVRSRDGGKVLGEAILTGLGERVSHTVEQRMPFQFSVDGQEYGLDLRPVLADLPFEIHVDKFVKEDLPNSTMVKDYSSFVTVTDGTGSHQAHIYMNAPLRKDGYVVYQSGWGPQRGSPPYFTTFEISRNPSDRWSIVSCAIIGLGLLIHFVLKLIRYMQYVSLQREAQKAGA